MTSPLVVVLVVALGRSDEATTAARTVQDTLGSEAVVLLREESNVDDGSVSRLGQTLHADALVRITWTRHDSRTEAHLHLYATGAKSWVDRDVPFERDDPAEERGRALGYGIASMVRVGIPPPAQAGVESQRPPPRVDASSFTRLSLDLRFQGAAATGSEGGSLGAESALGYRFSRPFAVRVAAGLRWGEVEPAAATTTFVRLGPGVSWTMFQSRGLRPLALGTRLDVIALGLTATRQDGQSTGSRWMLATGALLEAGWSVLPRGMLVAAMGAEVAFESTRILVDAREAARIAPVRLVGELGVRIGLE